MRVRSWITHIVITCLLALIVMLPASAIHKVQTFPRAYSTEDVKVIKEQLLSVPFTTEAAPGHREIHTYEILAEAGEFYLRTNDPVMMTLVDATGKVYPVEQETQQVQQFFLPAKGSYFLHVSSTQPINSAEIAVIGFDVELPDQQSPVLTMRQFRPFETITEPVDLEISVANAQIKPVQVLLNGELLYTLPPVEGTQKVGPAIIRPEELRDGIYRVAVAAQKDHSLTQTMLTYDFHVDLVNSFADVPREHWAHTPIEVMYHLQILHGRTSVQYAPDQSVTREEFAKILASTLNLDLVPNAPVTFADVPATSWSRSYIQALERAGYIVGEVVRGKSYFRPQRTITRAEACAIIGRRVLYLEDRDVDLVNGPFADYRGIPDWAKSSVVHLAESKWVSGFPDGTFRPHDTLTRAQAAQMISKFLRFE